MLLRMGYDLKLDNAMIVSYYRRFLMIGFTPLQSGNMVASILGLDTTKTGWTIKQLKGIMFLVDLVDHEKI